MMTNRHLVQAQYVYHTLSSIFFQSLDNDSKRQRQRQIHSITILVARDDKYEMIYRRSFSF